MLSKRRTFVIPENYKLGDVKIIAEKESVKQRKNKDLVAQFIPIRKVLKLYFELPPELQSKVENIFLFLLFNSKHCSMFTNTITFKKAIEEIQFLEREGISITIRHETKQIYFVMTLLLGNNLGLHSVLVFVESFSANFFCRFFFIE